MACVPCILIPFLLIIWRIIQPFVLKLWNPWKQVKDDKGNNTDVDTTPSFLKCPCEADGTCKRETKTQDQELTDATLQKEKTS